MTLNELSFYIFYVAISNYCSSTQSLDYHYRRYYKYYELQFCNAFNIYNAMFRVYDQNKRRLMIRKL